MSFLYPTFLWGLLAITIPIVIHIFNFRKTKRIYFSNISFLRNAKTETKSIRKIKEWLILFARILAIVSLVMAFSQPLISSHAGDEKKVNGISSFYLDNSFSMQSEFNTKRYFDVATGKMEELLGKFKYATNLQLITNDFTPDELGLSSSEKIRDRLTTLNLSPSSKSLQNIYDRQAKLLLKHNSNAQNQLYWFSDFQKSTVGDLRKLKVDATNQLYLIPIQANSYQNIHLDSVWLNTPFIRELQNNSLFVNVRNSGNTEVKNLILKLTLGNTQSSTASVNIKPNGKTIARFNFNINQKGFIRGKISFEDYPVIFDNEYYFVLQSSPRISVLQITGENKANNAINQVFSNDSLFNIQSSTTSSLDIGLIKNKDLVVINGVNSLGGALSSELKKFVSDGGTLTIIPSSNQQLTDFNTLLSSLGVNGLARPDLEELIKLKIPNAENPFYQDVFEQSYRDEKIIQMPSARPAWKWTKSGNTVLEYINGDTYLNQISSGTGKLYLFSAPIDSDAHAMSQHALFVPTMYKIAASSVQASKLAYTFNENPIIVDIKQSDLPKETLFKLKNGSTEIIPIQRIVRNQLFMELPSQHQVGNLQTGYYDITKDDKVIHTIALNIAASESDLASYTSEELSEIFKNHKNIKVLGGIESGEFENEFTSQNMGNTLWKYFLYSALFFLLIEIVLIRFLK